MKDYSINCHNPSPGYRTYIPKKGKKKLRPLGIPTIKDRVYQNIAKLALEPQWESIFEPTSYGFRPKRSAHDAIADIFVKTSKKEKWVFEGDFEGCFDNLNHQHILEKVEKFPAKLLINKWLKAGFLDNEVFNKTDKGTPQGGIISPLLANIALHGMEKELGINYKRYSNGYHQIYPVTGFGIVRYADDFVIVCNTKELAETMFEKLSPYLKLRGIKLSDEKTKISSTNEGFDFLGFNIRRYQTNQGEKLFIKPSKDNIQKFKDDIKNICGNSRKLDTDSLIRILNSKIRGWGNYYRHVVSKRTFSNLDSYTWKRTFLTTKREYNKHNILNMVKRYYKPDRTGVSKSKWLFTSPISGEQLTRMDWIPITRHVKILYKNSPFDKNLETYYHDRDIREFDANNPLSKRKIAKKQYYNCTMCGHSLANNKEGLETHHIVPKAQGGKDSYANLKLVHISCHIDYHKKYPVKGSQPTNRELRNDREERWKSRYFREYYMRILPTI